MVAVSAPYVAGFLAFREVPFLVEAVQRLQQEEPKLKPQVWHVSLSRVEMSWGHRVLLKGVHPSCDHAVRLFSTGRAESVMSESY